MCVVTTYYLVIYIYTLVGGLERVLLFHTLGRIITIDFHILQRGRSTTNQYLYVLFPTESAQTHLSPGGAGSQPVGGSTTSRVAGALLEHGAWHPQWPTIWRL